MDPDLQEHLHNLTGTIAEFYCTDFPEHTIYVCFESNYLSIIHSTPDNIDVKISGSLSQFINYAIYKDKISVSGDIKVLQHLQHFIQNLNLDWEEELSKYTNDVIANKAVTIIKSIYRHSKQISNNLQEMLTEYLEEEIKLLPTKYEINSFMREVDELRLAVDRIEAKINAYETT